MGVIVTVAAYVCVSTADQNPDRQLEATHDHAVDELPSTAGDTTPMCGEPIDATQSHMSKSVTKL